MLLQRAIDIASLNPKPLRVNFYIKVNSLNLSMRRQSESMNISLKSFDGVLLPLYILTQKLNDSLEKEHSSTDWATKSATHKFLLHTQILLPASNFPTNVDEFKELNVSPADFYCSGPIGKVLNPKP